MWLPLTRLFSLLMLLKRHCIGAIDGTHIEIVLPEKGQASAYYDYKGKRQSFPR